MKIAVNTRLLLKDRLEGIGWFTCETLKRITRNNSNVDFLFLFDRPYSEEFIFSKNITPVIIPPKARHPVLFYYWFEHAIAKTLKKEGCDLFLSPDGFLPIKSKIKKLPVIHDINFHHRPKDVPLAPRLYYNHFFPKFAKSANRIATVSEYSKNDIARSYEVNVDKIDVVYNGANPVFKPLGEQEKCNTLQKYSGGSEYFVFIGSLHPRKNLSRLLQAFDQYKTESPSDKKLIIVGEKMFHTREPAYTYQKMKYRNDVIWLGRLLPEQLHLVLGSAFALTFVPVFEGFGIPILEAMYCDVPVLCSNVTSMPEVGGDAVLYSDPYSIESIKEGMSMIDKNAALRKDLIMKARIQRSKFSWDKSAEKLWQCIQTCISE